MSNLFYLLGIFFIATLQAAQPKFDIIALTSPTLVIPSNGTDEVQYRVTNQLNRTFTLTIEPTLGITQTTTDGFCASPFTLAPHQSCVLTLTIDGEVLSRTGINSINGGPVVCKAQSNGAPDPFLCSQPCNPNSLAITIGPALTTAKILLRDSPLVLLKNGPARSMSVINASTEVTATNITSYFTGTALDGLVTETVNTCTTLLPRHRCTLTFTPHSTEIDFTHFPIYGDNTNTLTGIIAIGSPGVRFIFTNSIEPQ